GGRKASSRRSRSSASSFLLHLSRRSGFGSSRGPSRTGSVIAARDDGGIISTAASDGGSYNVTFARRIKLRCSCWRFGCSCHRRWWRFRGCLASVLFRWLGPRQIERAVIEFDDVPLPNHPMQIGRERQFRFLGLDHLSIRSN